VHFASDLKLIINIDRLYSNISIHTYYSSSCTLPGFGHLELGARLGPDETLGLDETLEWGWTQEGGARACHG
jgi:hypothetical protein